MPQNLTLTFRERVKRFRQPFRDVSILTVDRSTLTGGALNSSDNLLGCCTILKARSTNSVQQGPAQG
jgi:hypothetical protein